MTGRWYFKHAGQIYGPVTATQLHQLASQGKVLGTDLVWPEGSPASQAVVAQAALAIPAKPATVTQVAPPAQTWIEDVRAQAAQEPTPRTSKAVPDWLSDVEQVESEASAVTLAEVVSESAAVPPAAPPPLAASVASAPFLPPPQADGRCRFLVGSASTRGRVREKNEDSLLVTHWTWAHLDDRHELAVLAIADGMGGHGSGEKASALVVRSLAGLLTPTLVGLLQGSSQAATAESLSDELVRVLRECNRKVYDFAAANPACKGMGATVALVLLWDNQAIISHVGDCRVHHRRGKVLTQVTRDHTLVERMVRLGQLTPEEAAEHPRRNEVDQAVGPRTLIDPSRHALTLQHGDWLVVCCDGLYAHVDEPALQAALEQASSPPQLADHLIDLANQGGGSDNCTVIVVKCY